MRGRKRLRKKFCIGEFRELGFRVGFRLGEDLGEDVCRAVLDDFALRACKANGLIFAGAGRENRWEGFLVLDAYRGSVNEEQRKRVSEWFEGRAGIVEFEVGPLVDAWHDQ